MLIAFTDQTFGMERKTEKQFFQLIFYQATSTKTEEKYSNSKETAVALLSSAELKFPFSISHPPNQTNQPTRNEEDTLNAEGPKDSERERKRRFLQYWWLHIGFPGSL